jgi:DNA-binding NarL/FixJ family response regulator
VGGGIPLTARETQVLRLIAMGLSNQEIADSLEISVETVKEHVQNLLRKTSLNDRTQAAVWAIRQGIA